MCRHVWNRNNRMKTLDEHFNGPGPLFPADALNNTITLSSIFLVLCVTFPQITAQVPYLGYRSDSRWALQSVSLRVITQSCAAAADVSASKITWGDWLTDLNELCLSLSHTGWIPCKTWLLMLALATASSNSKTLWRLLFCIRKLYNKQAVRGKQSSVFAFTLKKQNSSQSDVIMRMFFVWDV